MTIIQSKINLLNAQIEQLETSDLFNTEEKIQLCAPLKVRIYELSKGTEIKE